MQLFEKYGTLIERNTALIEKVSPCRTSFSSDIARVMIENASLFSKVKAVREQIAKYKSENEELTNELATSTKMYDASIEDLLAQKEEKSSLQEQLKKGHQIMEELSLPGGEIYRLKIMLEEAQLAKHVLQGEYDAAVDAWTVKFNQEKSSHDALKEAHEKLGLQKEKEEARLEAIIAEIRETLGDKIFKQGRELDETHSRLKAALARVAELEAELEEFKRAANREIHELKAKIIDMEGAADSLAKQTAQEKQALEDEIERLKSIVGDKQTTIEKLHKAMEDLKQELLDAQQETNESKEAMKGAQQGEVKAKQEASEQRQEVERLQKQLKAADESKIKMEEEKDAEIELLKKNIAKLEGKLEAAKKDAEKRVEKEREKQEKKIGEKAKQIEKLKDSVKALKIAAKEEKTAKDKLKVELEGIISERDATIKKLEKTIKDRDGSIAALMAEKENLQKQLADEKAAKAAMEEEYKMKLQKQKEAYEEKILILNNKVNTLEKHKQRLEKKVEGLEKDLKAERADRQTLAHNMGAAFVKADATHAKQVSDLEIAFQQRLSEQHKKIEGIGAALATVEGYRRSLVTQRSVLRKRLQNNVSELQKSKNETAAVRAEIQNLLQQVKKLETYLERYKERQKTSEAGCQADMHVSMEEMILRIQKAANAAAKDHGPSEKAIVMMTQAIDIVKVLEDVAGLQKGSVAYFFRSAVDNFEEIIEGQQKEIDALAGKCKIAESTAQKGANVHFVESKALERELAELRARNSEVIAKVKDAATAAELQQRVEKAEFELDEMKDELENAQRINDALQDAHLALATTAAEKFCDLELLSAREYQQLVGEVQDAARSGGDIDARQLAADVEAVAIARAKDAGEQLAAQATDAVGYIDSEETQQLQSLVAELRRQKDEVDKGTTRVPVPRYHTGTLVHVLSIDSCMRQVINVVVPGTGTNLLCLITKITTRTASRIRFLVSPFLRTNFRDFPFRIRRIVSSSDIPNRL
eukprot:SAG31_NODE_837_length_11633_cov_18.437663_7_plen_989_part_00